MDKKEINALCSICRVPVIGPANPNDDDLFSCPCCGKKSKLSDIMVSVKIYLRAANDDGILLNSLSQKQSGTRKFSIDIIGADEMLPFIVEL